MKSKIVCETDGGVRTVLCELSDKIDAHVSFDWSRYTSMPISNLKVNQGQCPECGRA